MGEPRLGAHRRRLGRDTIIRILRELRIQRGVTLQRLADAIGMTPGYLSQLERNRVSPSVETLSRLALYYNVPVSFFFEDDADGVSIVRHGSHLLLSTVEGGAQFQLLSPDLNRRIEFLRITVEPGGATHSHFNRHPGEEVHYVIQGSLEIEVDGRTYSVNEGDSIYFHSTLPHRVRNPGKVRSVVLTAMSPPTKWAKQMLGTQGKDAKLVKRRDADALPIRPGKRRRRKTSAGGLS